MDFVIGKQIRKKIEDKGMTFVAFADKFGVTDRNLQYLFSKSDLPISQIVRAGEILQHDFVTEYLRSKNPKYKIATGINRVEESGEVYGIDEEKNMPKLSYEFAIPESAYGNIKAFQDDILKLAEKHGMIIN